MIQHREFEIYIISWLNSNKKYQSFEFHLFLQLSERVSPLCQRGSSENMFHYWKAYVIGGTNFYWLLNCLYKYSDGKAQRLCPNLYPNPNPWLNDSPKPKQNPMDLEPNPKPISLFVASLMTVAHDCTWRMRIGGGASVSVCVHSALASATPSPKIVLWSRARQKANQCKSVFPISFIF